MMQEKIIDGCPYWIRTEQPVLYPWLSEEEKCEVAVIGGGITGAMCAQRFAEAGVDTILVTSEPVGYGMTSAALGIADHTVSGGVSMLERKIGTDAAVQVFQTLKGSVDHLEELCGRLSEPVETMRRDSLQYTSNPHMGKAFRQEYRIQRHNDFDVELIDSTAAMSDYSFPLDTGLLCHNAVLEFNPYALVRSLIRSAVENGARVYENTRVDRVCDGKDGAELHCSSNYTITAKKVIYAYGAREAESMEIANTKTNFCLVTKPVENFHGWKGRAVLSDVTPSQAVTLRTTPDDRIIICGLATRLMDLEGKLGGVLSLPRMIQKKYAELEQCLHTMLKGIRGVQTECRFASLMPETTDNLPVVGLPSAQSSVIRALCPGQNGIAFAELLSRMILEYYQGREEKEIHLFSPERKSNFVHA